MIEPTGTLLAEIRNRQATRDDVAESYAYALRRPNVDWSEVNAAILMRWSMSGLRYIKRRAWKLKEQREKGAVR